MKAQFFMNMNDMAINKNDELKYLILMREEFFKYKLKLYYFHKWKCRALYNRDLIDEEDPFNVKSGVNYNQFKNMNYGGQPGILDSLNSNSKNNNFSDNKNSFKKLNSNDGNIFGSLNYFNDSNGNKNDLIRFDEDPKIIDNQNQNNNQNNNFNKNGLFQLTDSKLSFGPNQNQQLNNIFNSLNSLRNEAMNDTEQKNLNNNIFAANSDQIYKNMNLSDKLNKNLNSQYNNNNLNSADSDQINKNMNLNDKMNKNLKAQYNNNLNSAYSEQI